MLHRTCILFLVWMTAATVYAQESNIAIGTWRVHLPYDNLKTVAVSGNKIYAAQGSSIFDFDKEDNSINIHSKYTGLHDVLASKIAYNATHGATLIGFETGNIDMIKGNTLTNINDIERSGIVTSKKINHFCMNNDLVYISGDYGMTLYDLKKNEVKESYLTLTSDLSVNAVFASALTSDKDSIFIATSKGMMTAKISQAINLMDYTNWYTFVTNDSLPTVNVVSVCEHNGVMYAGVANKGIYYYNGSKWRKMSLPLTGGGNIRNLNASADGVLVCMDTSVFRISSPSSWSEIFHRDNVTPIEASYDSEHTLWIASRTGGLIRYQDGSSTLITPNGPFIKDVFKLGYYNNTIVSLAGAYGIIGGRSYYGYWHSFFDNNTSWVSAYTKFPSVSGVYRDFISATYNEQNATLYFSSYGEGLIAIDANNNVVAYTNANSPLKRTGALQNGDLYVGETTVDKDGYLWVPNRDVITGLPNIHKLSPQGEWSSYVLSSSIARNVIRVTIDDYDTKWISTVGNSGTGIIVFNEKKNLTRTLTGTVGAGHLPDTKVNCVVSDKKGVVYVGTNAGIAVCYNPFNIFTNGVDLVTPIFDGFPILFERNILAIAVDGGNRKWVGTNDGLWLFNDDLTKVLLYFNTENSPLLSDYISDIKIHPLSGEVFLATPEGVISYRGTATEGDENYTNVKVFPNPVKPGYSGMVGITGLATDVAVKITDIAGNLVYETKAEGGAAVWNVKDYNGQRAATGVYLIFCTAADGTAKFVSKIAVIE